MKFSTFVTMCYASVTGFFFFVGSIYYAREVRDNHKQNQTNAPKALPSTASADTPNPPRNKNETRIDIDEEAGHSRTATMDEAKHDERCAYTDSDSLSDSLTMNVCDNEQQKTGHGH